MAFHILSISDIIVNLLNSPEIVNHFQDVDLVISCGDLPYTYLDYVVSNLNVPLFFVRGNHDKPIEHTTKGPKKAPSGGVDLHRTFVNHNGLLVVGVEGSLRYNRPVYQYSQGEMWGHVLSLVPHLLFNKLVYGRFLDIFVSHAPPWGINDEQDPAHRGIKAFRWLLDVFPPSYHIHGHIHLITPKNIPATRYKSTAVLNTYGYRTLTVTKPTSSIRENGEKLV